MKKLLLVLAVAFFSNVMAQAYEPLKDDCIYERGIQYYESLETGEIYHWTIYCEIDCINLIYIDRKYYMAIDKDSDYESWHTNRVKKLDPVKFVGYGQACR